MLSLANHESRRLEVRPVYRVRGIQPIERHDSLGK